MAAKEIYDYIATATPDTSVIMTLTAQGAIKERAFINQIVHLGDDGSDEIITLSTAKAFYLDIPWSALSESDAGTLMDFFLAATLGNGKARTFPYTHIYGSATHTYVVRFDSDFYRDIKEGNFHASQISLKIKGRIPD